MLSAYLCPNCGGKSVIYDSRKLKDGSVMRRKKCRKCGIRFCTNERYAGRIGVLGHVEEKNYNI